MNPAWDGVPAGLLTLDGNGTVVAANRTALSWIGRPPDDVLGRVQLSELLSAGGRIYWETHLSPLLHAEGRADEVALELRTGEGRMPVLLSAVVTRAGEPQPDRSGDAVHVVLSSARQRAHYERELRAARAAAETALVQLRSLQAVTASLSRAVGVDAIGEALLSAAVGPLGARAATLWLSGPEGVTEFGSSGAIPDVAPAPSASLAPRASLARGAGACVLGAHVVVPLEGRAESWGELVLAPRTEPGADPLDLPMLTAVGQQAGLALDRARLHEQNATVARELQHSLLAVPPHHDPRIGVASVYRPGIEMLQVGGDWHDVFLVEHDVLGIVVGDVVGRGLAAASAMGQLRSAVRAVAGPGVGPARLLERLDAFVDQVDTANMATVAYAELNLNTGSLRYACAGHPPPVLVSRDGPPRLLWDGRSLPLGFLHRARREGEVTVSAGDRLLLYTDGLIERRGRSLDEGLSGLLAAASLMHEEALDAAVATLTRELLRDEQVRDDVCVLLLERSG